MALCRLILAESSCGSISSSLARCVLSTLHQSVPGNTPKPVTELVGHFDGTEEAFEAFPYASWEVDVALAASPDEIVIHLACPPDDFDS